MDAEPAPQPPESESEPEIEPESAPGPTPESDQRGGINNLIESPSPPPAPPPPPPPPPDDRQAVLDALDTEFIYYASALRELTPLLASSAERASLEPWVRRLFSPEYCSDALKDRRNRLVCYLSVWLSAAVARDAEEVLPECPPRGPAPSPQDLGPAPYTTASWEVDSQWLHYLKSVASGARARCDQHKEGCPPDGTSTGWDIDQELKLLLHLAGPLRPQLGSAGERRLCTRWLHYLCSATPQDCQALRRRRNQYARVLLGYLHGGELKGPFCAEPPWGKALPALGGSDGVTGAGGGAGAGLDGGGGAGAGGVGDFLPMQPVPDEGAFCYVVVDGVVPTELKC